MATPKYTPVWPSIDFTDALVPLEYIEDSLKEDCSKKDGTVEDPYEATTKTFGGCYNIVTDIKPYVWNDKWWEKFQKRIKETAKELEIRLGHSNLVITQMAKCHFGYFDGDLVSDHEEESPYFNIEFNFDTLEMIFREYQVEESNGTRWQKTVALENAYYQKLLEMEVLERSFETIFAEAITDSFDGRYKKIKAEYYVEMATTYVLIRALAFYTVECYEVMLKEKEKRDREIAEIDAKAEEHKKRLKKEHEASIKKQMTEFDKQMAFMQEQMQKMQEQMQKMQDKKEDIKKSCENDLKEALEEAEKVRDEQVKECVQKHYANVEGTEEVPVVNDFQTLQDGNARDDGTMNNPHLIDDDTPPESQLDINSNMLAVKVARIDAGEVNGEPVEGALPQVSTKQDATKALALQNRQKIIAVEKAVKEREAEEAANLRKKATAKKRKRNEKDSSGSSQKRQAPQAQQAPQGTRRSARPSKPPERFGPSGRGKTAYVNDALLGMGGKQKKGKQVTSPNAVVEIEEAKIVN